MKKLLLYTAAACVLSACTYAISKDIRETAARDIPFREVRANIEDYKGQTFIWGGFVVTTRRTEEGIYLEVVQNPLDRYGAVIDTDTSEGRFLVLTQKDLDPLIYEKGRLVTVAGVLIGSKTVKRNKRDYTYPVLELKELYLWRETEYVYPYDYWYWDRYPYWWDYWPYSYYPPYRRF